MNAVGFLLIAIIIALPIAWLWSEFKESRPLRISLGLVALGVMTCCAWGLSSILNTFNYNAYYGAATGELIKSSLNQIEDGHLDRVLKIWRGLAQHYHPTYENRARYRELVNEATSRLRGDVPIESGSAWDGSVFNKENWIGHWEDDSGYWLVVNDLDKPFDIVRSGYPPTKMHSVSVSPDFKILKFKEGDQWSHTITLRNKYEATHEWLDLSNNTVWETDKIYKLIRSSPEQRIMTVSGAADEHQLIRSETNQIPSQNLRKRKEHAKSLQEFFNQLRVVG